MLTSAEGDGCSDTPTAHLRRDRVSLSSALRAKRSARAACDVETVQRGRAVMTFHPADGQSFDQEALGEYVRERRSELPVSSDAAINWPQGRISPTTIDWSPIGSVTRRLAGDENEREQELVLCDC